jgi:hypothetical protein
MRIDRQRFSSFVLDVQARSASSICLVGSVYPGKTARRSDELAQTCCLTPDRGDVCIMQGQIGGVNGFVVIIFVHYILSDKVVLELKSQAWLAVASLESAPVGARLAREER